MYSYGAVIVARSSDEVRMKLSCPTEVVIGKMSLNEARNIGASKLKTDLIAFIDADNILDASALELLANTFYEDRIAVVSPVIFDREDNIWFAGSRLNRLGVFSFDRTMPRSRRYTDAFHDVFMIRRDVFEAVGGFDSEHFPFYLGEADLAERMKKLGYHFVVQPKALVWHDIEPLKGLRSIARSAHIRDKQRAYLVGRNLLLLLKLYKPLSTVLLHELFVLPVRTMLHVLGILASGRSELVRPYLHGIWDGLR